MLEPYYPEPVQLMRIATGLPLANALQQIVVPVPDPRIAVYFALVWRADNGSQAVVPPGQKKVFVAARVKSSKLDGISFPVTAILGNGFNSTADMADLIPAANQVANSLQGYSRELQTAADEIFIAAYLNDVATSGQTGTWYLVTKYTPAELMCDEEWTAIKSRCSPRLITFAGTSPN
jgi:hypothetical protein